MTIKSFAVDFTDVDSNFIDQAIQINEELFNKILAEKIKEAAQSIVFSYVDKKLKEDNESKTRLRKLDDEIIKNDKSDVTFDYADRQWKENAINAVLEASCRNESITPDEIFDKIGVSPLRRKSFRLKLGRLMKQSGVKCVKSACNGTTRTAYYV